MNRSTSFGLLLTALLSLAALTPAQTAPSPEALAAMKARLAQIKLEAADLEAKIAAAEVPPAGTQPPIIAALNAMPKNLWPGDSDTDMKSSLRDKWLTDNIKPGTSGTFTGTILVATASTLYPPGKPQFEGVRVVLNCGKFLVWGKETDLKILAVLENVTPADTLDWAENKTITITGISKETRTTNPVEITLETSKMK